MNKKIILLIIAVFTMFLTPEVVKAAECVYGTVANGSWEKLVTIIVNDSDKSNMIARVKYNSEDSPIFGSVYGVNWYGVFGDASAFKGVEYDSDVVRASTWNLSYGPLDFAISVKLYADPSIYQDETQFNESVCPPRILVSTEVNSYWGLKTWLAMYFYADNLLTPNNSPLRRA